MSHNEIAACTNCTAIENHHKQLERNYNELRHTYNTLADTFQDINTAYYALVKKVKNHAPELLI